MSEEIHVFVTVNGERVSIGAQPSAEGARKTIESFMRLSKIDKMKLGYSNPRMKTLKF